EVDACGNLVIDDDEECDDGNKDDDDGCDAQCLLECGNEQIDGDEECDDGNRVPGDGCDENCMIEVPCGDGDIDPGEECDDGNNTNGDGCDEFCNGEGVIGIERIGGCIFDTMDDAVDAAIAGDVILIGADLVGSDGTITTTLPGPLTVTTGNDICQQPDPTQRRRINLQSADFVDTVTFSFTIENLLLDNGGNTVIASTGGSIHLTDVHFDDSVGVMLDLLDSDATITRTQFINSSDTSLIVDETGASTSTVTITDSEFNDSYEAISIASGDVSLAGSLVANQDYILAVEVWSSTGSFTATQSRFENNAILGVDPFLGASVHAFLGATAYLENCLVTGNPAGGPAVAATGTGSSLSLMQVTLAGNAGAGLRSSLGADVFITNSIEHNGARSRVDAASTLTANCVNMRNPIGPAASKTSIAPVFNLPPALNADFTLSAASPSIDQCATGQRPDLVGNGLAGLAYDQGAFERQ
ncbi:MAG: DUF4215 domain-containing protein, partial [Myxococcota bacterium]